MDYYASIERITATIIGISADGLAARIREQLPARIEDFIRSDALVRGISGAQTAAAIISAAFAALLVYAVLKKKGLAAPVVAAAPTGVDAAVPVAASPLRSQWAAVVAYLDSPREADWKVAVMEADKLVDDALARSGFPGDTFGDRLTNIAPGTLVSLDGIWWAHRIRNRLAHETDYFLRYTEARQAIGYYEQALAELQLL